MIHQGKRAARRLSNHAALISLMRGDHHFISSFHFGRRSLSLTRISFDTLPIREYSNSSNNEGSRWLRSYREIAPESTFRRFATHLPHYRNLGPRGASRRRDRRRPLQAGRVEPEVSLARPKLKVRQGGAHALRVGSSRPVRAQDSLLTWPRRVCRNHLVKPMAGKRIAPVHPGTYLKELLEMLLRTSSANLLSKKRERARQ